MANWPDGARVTILGFVPGVVADVQGTGTAGTPAGGILTVQSAGILARTAHLASNALPAAGAFTDVANAAFYPTGRFQIPATLRGMSFWTTYARGGAGGFPRLRLVWGNGTEEAQELLLGTTAPSSPLARQQVFLGELDMPPPAGAASLTYGPITAEVPPGATTVWVQAAEAGATATPGTIAVALSGVYR